MRERKRDRVIGFTNDSRAYLALIEHDPCSYCGAPYDEPDHIVAVVEGGTSAWDNFTAACRSCNASKQQKTLLVFLLRKNGWTL
jgi:5-methylcytosine-specific restriction endonuclease McrA